jgi:hypothetical protein
VTLQHFVLKFGYTLPALLLMVDMWVHYNNYHVALQNEYREWDLFLDAVLLALMYAALSRLRGSPEAGDAVFRTYPSTGFWPWLIAYSLVKVWRTWRMSLKPPKPSWYTVLHFLLLLLIITGWLWQDGRFTVPLPFWASGFVFTGVIAVYLVCVYGFRCNPLNAVGRTES